MSGVDPVVSRTIAATLAVVFAVAAWHKLRDLRAFAGAVAAYEIAPVRFAGTIAVGLAGVEAVAAALAFVAPLRSAAVAAFVALLLLYAGAMALALARGRRELDCGCFGPARGRPVGPALVLRNLGLAALGALALAPESARPLVGLDVATGCLATAAALLLLASLDQALANAPGLRALGAQER